MFIGGFLSLIFLVWMIAKIWKQSAGLAIASIFLWPCLLYALFKYWGDEESDIRLPFILWAVSVSYAWYDIFETTRALKEEQDAFLAIVQVFA